MVDGFWTVLFEGVPNFLGGGVAVFLGNHIYGGDSQYFYTGLYDVKGSKISALLQITAFVPAPVNAFGTGEKMFSLQFDGIVEGNYIKGVGQRPDAPGVQLRMSLARRSELA